MTPAEHLVDLLSAKRNGAGWIAKCPTHEDRQPSLSIHEGADGRVLLKCFAGCTTANLVAAIGLTLRDLFPTRSRSQSAKPAPAKKNNGAVAAFDWSECVAALNGPELIRLGNQRWWSREFCAWLRDEKKIGLYKGHFAFPVERDGKIVAVKYKWGSGPNDWGVYPTEQGAACFILGDPKRAKNIHLDESQWDICSLADRTDWFRDADNHAFVATPGAGNAKLIKGLIPPGASVLAWPQNDPPGEKWLRDVARYADVPIAKAIVPARHKDLGEWSNAGASTAAITTPGGAMNWLKCRNFPTWERCWTRYANFCGNTSLLLPRRSQPSLPYGSFTPGSSMCLSLRLISTFFRQREVAVNRTCWNALPNLRITS